MSFIRQKAVLPPPPPTLELVIPARQKTGVLNTINTIQRLFGRGGKHWTKGTYKTTKDGFAAFCLVGAEREANTQFEPAARAAIALAINKYTDRKYKVYPHSSDSGLESPTINFNDNPDTKWTDVLKVLNIARRLVRNAAVK
jgi:hypothetical protein